MGFKEKNFFDTRKLLNYDGRILTSLVNNKKYDTGKFYLFNRYKFVRSNNGKTIVRIIKDDVKRLHILEENYGACFQVASQFNCLEMMNEYVTKFDGVGIYERDHTQGPACSISCGPATIARNYFYDINLLDEFPKNLWKMKNGYCFPYKNKKHLLNELDLCNLINIGIQENTQVTTTENQFVNQIFCSALPMGYLSYDYGNDKDIEDFAKALLEVQYDLTLKYAMMTKKKKVYLTLLGGGVFGNDIEWIVEAIKKAIDNVLGKELEIIIVCYDNIPKLLIDLVEEYK
jgi:hypothetical protein